MIAAARRSAGLLLALLGAATIFVLAGTAAKTALAAGLPIALLCWYRRAPAARVLAVLTVLVVVTAPLTFARLDRGAGFLRTADSVKLSAGHRLLIWSFVGDRIAEHPLRGWGLDSSRAIPGGTDLIRPNQAWLPLHPHNAPLQLWLELGVPGVVPFALLGGWLWLALGRADWPRFYAAAAGGSLATAFAASLATYGIWQEWWEGTLAFALFMVLVMARVAAAARIALMRVFTSLPTRQWREAGPFAAAAEAAGFDALATVELGHDPFAPLAFAALATGRIELTTSVAVAFPRSPTVVASQAWDLHANANGRFVLGLGSQVKGHNERRFGVAWSAPAPRLRDYVGALRAIWRCWETGERLDYRGTHYQLTLMTPDFSPEPTGLPPVPVAIAAVGAAMLRVAGEVCDGVRLHPLCSRRYLEEVCLPQLREGMQRGGRRPREFRPARRRFCRDRRGRGRGRGCGRRGSPARRALRLDPHLSADPVAARARRSRAQAASPVGRRAVERDAGRNYRTTRYGSSPPAAPIARSRLRSKRASGALPTRSTSAFPPTLRPGCGASWWPTSAAYRISSKGSPPPERSSMLALVNADESAGPRWRSAPDRRSAAIRTVRPTENGRSGQRSRSPSTPKETQPKPESA